MVRIRIVKTCRPLIPFMLVVLPSRSSFGYPYGILPVSRDYGQVLHYWERFKNVHMSIESNTASASGLWEFQAFAMVFAAYLEEDEALFAKLWNRVAAPGDRPIQRCRPGVIRSES